MSHPHTLRITLGLSNFTPPLTARTSPLHCIFTPVLDGLCMLNLLSLLIQFDRNPSFHNFCTKN